MRHYFTFDGIKSSDYGVLISGENTFGAPARDIDEIVVPGRDGNLTIDNGRFSAASVIYPAFIPETAKANLQGLRNALMAKRGHRMLQDSLHPDEFYSAYYEKGLEPEMTANLLHSSLEIEFTRDPRRFLAAGNKAYSVPTTATALAPFEMYNPTLFESSPLIRVYGTGVLHVNNMTITATGTYTYIDIDTEIGDCYFGATNANDKVTFSGYDYPKLVPGSNAFYYTDFSAVEVTPRWWRL